MKKSEANQVYKLIEEWTVAEIKARLGYHIPDCIDYYNLKVQKEDKLRELLYGTSNLVELGGLFGLLNQNRKKKKRKKKKNNKGKRRKKLI